MSTTTIRIPEHLKARVTVAAKRTGTTSHNFILEAIAEKTDRTEQRDAFNALAETRYAQFVADGKTIPWNEMRSYLEARLAGKTMRRPSAKKLVR